MDQSSSRNPPARGPMPWLPGHPFAGESGQPKGEAPAADSSLTPAEQGCPLWLGRRLVATELPPPSGGSKDLRWRADPSGRCGPLLPVSRSPGQRGTGGSGLGSTPPGRARTVAGLSMLRAGPEPLLAHPAGVSAAAAGRLGHGRRLFYPGANCTKPRPRLRPSWKASGSASARPGLGPPARGLLVSQ